MKKLLLSLFVSAFAVAVQAGDDGACTSCCAASKDSVQAKSECSMAKQAKAKKGARQASAKQVLKSPKATS